MAADLRSSLKLMIETKLMPDDGEALWMALVDKLDDEQCKLFFGHFQSENEGFEKASDSLDGYLVYHASVSEARISFLTELQNDSNLSDTCAALLKPAQQFTEQQLDEAFGDDEDKAAEFLASLSVDQLELYKHSVDAQHSDGKMGDDEHETLMTLLGEVQKEAFANEKEAAEALHFFSESIGIAIGLSAQIEALKDIQAEVS